jgi:hypothetical protein
VRFCFIIYIFFCNNNKKIKYRKLQQNKKIDGKNSQREKTTTKICAGDKKIFFTTTYTIHSTRLNSMIRCNLLIFFCLKFLPQTHVCCDSPRWEDLHYLDSIDQQLHYSCHFHCAFFLHLVLESSFLVVQSHHYS